MAETKKEEKKKLADEDAARRIKQLEDQTETLRKQVANQKQEEETLLSDMEVTGQAFEDMQEQNGRLVQQLREKDDANFKLMSERIKSNQIARLAREEKEMYLQQVATLTTQVEAQNQVVRKLEEKERLLLQNLATHEKELALRQQAMEMHKRKAIESAQSAADLKLHLEKYHRFENTYLSLLIHITLSMLLSAKLKKFSKLSQRKPLHLNLKHLKPKECMRIQLSSSAKLND